MRYLLGIDTSCDDTSVGVVELTSSGPVVRSNVVWSQTVHAAYGGVMPELASREHVRRLDEVRERALQEAKIELAQIDAIAATHGPGLMGALLVGLMHGKGLAQALGVPFHGVHHLAGHIQAAKLGNPEAAAVDGPFLALVVSGGHTHLFDCPAPARYTLVACTRDDAAGEAFDKVARLAGLGHPGGPAIAKAAASGNPKAVQFKMPLSGQTGFEFSFSGLKTAAMLAWQKGDLSPEDLAASFQSVVVKSLVKTSLRAAAHLERTVLLVSGGVAANAALREVFLREGKKAGVEVFFPPADLNTDNGAMIALAAASEIALGKPPSGLNGGATPYLPLDEVSF